MRTIAIAILAVAGAALPAAASCNYGETVEFPMGSGHAPNYLLGNPVVVSMGGNVTALALISKDSGQMVRLALYTDGGGGPANLVVATASTPVSTGTMEIPVAPTAIAAGTYWIMGIFD